MQCVRYTLCPCGRPCRTNCSRCALERGLSVYGRSDFFGASAGSVVGDANTYARGCRPSDGCRSALYKCYESCLEHASKQLLCTPQWSAAQHVSKPLYCRARGSPQLFFLDCVLYVQACQGRLPASGACLRSSLPWVLAQSVKGACLPWAPACLGCRPALLAQRARRPLVH